MIGQVGSSDYSAYVPRIRGGGQAACPCGQPGCNCTTAAGSAANTPPADARREDNAAASTNNSAERADRVAASRETAASRTQYTEAELAMLRELKQRDRQVRQHELAHIAASGGLAQGGAQFTYQRGPDGQNYAVGGHVSIDISPGKTPEETLRKAQTIRAAALAPADPSGQDRAVAARASQMEMQARIELTQQQQAERTAPDDPDSPAARLAQRFFAAITPQPEPSFQVAA